MRDVLARRGTTHRASADCPGKRHDLWTSGLSETGQSKASGSNWVGGGLSRRLTSRGTSPSMRPESSSVVPASAHVLVAVEAFLLACVLFKVPPGSGPAGAPPSEPGKGSMCVRQLQQRGGLWLSFSHLSSRRPLKSAPPYLSSGSQVPPLPPTPLCPPPRCPPSPPPWYPGPGLQPSSDRP